MPGKEIKGRSKIASYRHGGRTGFKEGSKTGTFLTNQLFAPVAAEVDV